MLKVVHIIQHLPIQYYLLRSVFPFPGGNHVLALFNPYFHTKLVSQSARKICRPKFVFGSCSDVDVSC